MLYYSYTTIYLYDTPMKQQLIEEMRAAGWRPEDIEAAQASPLWSVAIEEPEDGKRLLAD